MRTRASGAALFIVSVCQSLGAESAPIPYHVQGFRADSGPQRAAVGRPALVWSTVVSVRSAPWLRLDLAGTALVGPVRGSDSAYLRLVSVDDGGEQFLNADGLAQWNATSAYFNGSAVLVELYASSAGASRVMIGAISVGDPGAAGGVATICGPTDDRVATTDPRDGRIMPVGCTGWLFDGHPFCFLSAGHCFDGAGGDTVEFNVPPSLPNGTVQHPSPSDQYSVDPASVQFNNGVIGNDWAYFGVFPNSTTGLSPLSAQGASFPTQLPPGGNLGTLRVTGYGTDSGAANQTNQTATGPFVSLNGTELDHQVDTEAGNSGSPIRMTSTGKVVAIHTNGGCTAGAGSNAGTTLANAGLQSALANPQGICATGALACGVSGAGSCYVIHAGTFCDDADCCNAVCDVDAFCCENSWDETCTAEAFEICGQCGTPAAGSCYLVHPSPGCNSISCCQWVCAIDPFCCNETWDSDCVTSADTTCNCHSDLNGNGNVGGGDLAVLLGAYGSAGGPADLDGNGTVGAGDLAILLGDWGPCP